MTELALTFYAPKALTVFFSVQITRTTRIVPIGLGMAFSPTTSVYILTVSYSTVFVFLLLG